MSDDFDYQSVPPSGVPMTCPNCAKLRGLVDDANSRVADVLGSVITLRAALSQAEDKAATARAEVNSKSNQIVELQTELERRFNLEDELAAARAEADAMREALETSSEMMKAMAQQLASWGHETVVNYRGQLAKNAALRSGRPQGEEK